VKTLNFLCFFDRDFDILTPYCLKTKEDVLSIFKKYDEKAILSSSVSCSSTRNQPGNTDHCGCCSQCIDRRLAAYATGLDEYDALYAKDFITKIPDDDNNETRQRLYYTLRLASAEKAKSAMDLYTNYPDEMTDVVNYWPGDNLDDRLAEIYLLFARFGDSVLRGAQAMRAKHDDLSIPTPDNSFLSILSSRDYLKTPTRIRVDEINKILITSIPQVFHKEKPKNENDFNDKIKALLAAARSSFTREYPVLKFGITSYKADLGEEGLIIESKYLRDKVTSSVATEGIAADITKVPAGVGLLFVVYDPARNIKDDDAFIDGFEQKRQDCFVRVYR